MPVEIERKFLVTGDGWRAAASGTRFQQGYLSTDPERSVRVRVADDEAWLTIKGATRGARRVEYEYPVPAAEAIEMLQSLCLPGAIDKTRYRTEHAGLVWEIDVFSGENAGLVVAEVELADEDQRVSLPDWVGREVTHEPRYYNASLVTHPFSQWTDDERG